MKSALIIFPECKFECLAAIEAIHIAVINVPVSFNFDVVVFDEQIEEILKATYLARNIVLSTNYSDFIEDNPNIYGMYDIIYQVSPEISDGIYYGEEAKEKKTEEVRKILGSDPSQDLPANPYNMIATTVCDLSSTLVVDSRPDFCIQDNIKVEGLSPFVRTTSDARKSIRKKLNKSILGHDGLLIKNDDYVVFAIHNNIDSSSAFSGLDSENKIILHDFLSLTEDIEVPIILLEESGKIYGCEETITTIEQLSLIEHENCICVLSQDWRSWVSWSFKKNITIDIVPNEEVGYWRGVRSTKAIIYPLDKKPILELKEHMKNIVEQAQKLV